MAFTVIYGKPRSGKSYTCTNRITLQILAHCRKLYTSIKGTDPQAMSDYLNWIANFKAGRTTENFKGAQLLRPKNVSERLFNLLRGVKYDKGGKPTLFDNEEELYRILCDHDDKELISGNYDFTKFVVLLPENPKWIYKDGKITDELNRQLWFIDSSTSGMMEQDSVLIVDEVGRMFKDNKKKADFLELMNGFISLHGHHGFDVYFIAQNSNQIPNEVRVQAQYTYYVEKTTRYGAMSGDTFSLYIFEDVMTFTEIKEQVTKKKTDLAPIVDILNPRIFLLYRSFESKSGIKTVTVGDTSIWNQTFYGIKIKYYIPLLPIGFIFLIYKIVTGVSNQISHPIGNAPIVASAASAASSPSSGVPVQYTAQAAPVSQVKKEESEFSSEYRLIGIYTIKGVPTAVLRHKQYGYRYVIEFAYSSQTTMPEIVYKGKLVNYFTGEFSDVKEKISESPNEKSNKSYIPGL